MTTELLGDVLGHHELVRVIGGGPGGPVYEAFDPRLGRRVAIKTFGLDSLEPRERDAFETRLRASAAAAAALQHPNIVAVYDCDRHGQTASLAMEFVEGENLAQHLARVGKLPALQALALVAQLLSALEVAHAQGIAHGRITPEHLLVSRCGQLKVAGFGVPRPTEPVIAGDLFCAAAIAYQLFTGALPARQPGPAGQALTPHQLRPDLPAAVDAVFERALASNPRARYRNAGELFAALRTAFDPPLWVRPDKPSGAIAVAVAQSQPQQQREATAVAAVLIPVARGPAARPPRTATRAVRKRFAVAGACALGVAAVAALLLLGELGPLQRDATASARLPVTAAPASSVPVPVIAPAAPVLVAQEAPPSTAVETRQPEPAAAPPGLQPAPIEAEPEPREAGPGRAPSRSSVQRTTDTRVAGAGLAPRPMPQSRRQVSFTERQLARSGPDARCGHQQLAIAREICRVAQCATAELRAHPVCVRLHAEQRARDHLNEQASRTR